MAAIGVYCNASWLAAQAYLRFSDDRGQSPASLVVAQKAAHIARDLQPLSANALQTLALNDLLLGQYDIALKEYAAAIELAPADAYLWRDYALALVYSNNFDDRLDAAVRQAQSWGLQSRPIHLSLALAGLKVYHQSDAPLRDLWLKSIRRAYWDQPDAVLLTAYTSEEELLLCDGSVILKPESNVWCAAARWRHGLCSTPDTEASGCFGKHGAVP